MVDDDTLHADYIAMAPGDKDAAAHEHGHS